MKLSVQSVSQPLAAGEERAACLSVEPAGFHLRPPPPANELRDFITRDSQLFETIHMGPASVDSARWRLQVDGLVERSFSLDLAQLYALPARTVTAFHECWGSPLRERTSNLLRVGNVQWTGVPLRSLLDYAVPLPGARFVWSEGLDSGEFGGKRMDCYRKDLPLAKAFAEEVLLAYAMNGEPLRRERGGPVRLIVPGWFGTNMTKWLCRLTVQADRAPGPFTNEWYNETVESGGKLANRPVWDVAPNSMIVDPAAGTTIAGERGLLRGWAWAADPISHVDVSIDQGSTWTKVSVAPRQQHEWQAFEAPLEYSHVPAGELQVTVRATDVHGQTQPLGPGRNTCHSIVVQVRKA